ncbi:MAG: hypothetical protein OEV15_09490, partial [Gallionella sp.]|nr:hypothetical protein [Gallionella sp.]
TGVSDLTMRLWIAGGTGWRTVAEVAHLTATPAANPPSTPASAPPSLLTGLEVTLQLQGRKDSLRKIFLLGAV